MTKELVNNYYKRLAKKKGWHELLSDTIRFTMPGQVTNGKAAFVKGNEQFLQGVRAAKPKEMLFDGETACVWMSYDLVSPRGKECTLDVLEIWRVKDKLLDDLTIYFDSAAFGAFMQG